MDEAKRTRFAALGTVTALGVLGTAGLSSALLDEVVVLLYEERAPDLLNQLFQNREIHPVERYQADARAIVQPVLRRASVLTILLGLVSAAIHPRVTLVARVALAAVGVLTSRLALFVRSREALLPLTLAVAFVLVVPLPRFLQLCLGVAAAVLWGRKGATVLQSASTREPPRGRIVVVATAIGAAGVGLRLLSLDNLAPYTDEYMHLRQADVLLGGGDFTYRRAAIVTQAVALAYRIRPPVEFMDFVVVGRVPGALASAATVVPIYLLARHFGTRVGLLAAGMWAVHPWSTGVGRTIREYAYFSFFSTALMTAGVALVSRARQRPLLGSLVVLATASVSAAYARFDSSSTYTAHVLVTVGVVGGYWVFQTLDVSSRRARIVLLTALPFAAALGFTALARFNVPLDIVFPLRDRALYFVNLYAGGTAILSLPNFIVLATVLAASGLYRLRGSQQHLFAALLLTFLGVLLAMTLGWDRYYRPRYGFFLLPIFLILLSAGLDRFLSDVWGRIAPFFTERARPGWRLALLAGLLVYAVPLADLTDNVRSDAHGYVRFTVEYHDRVAGFVEFMQSEATADDALVATGVLVTPLRLVEAPITFGDRNLYGYSYRTSAAEGHPTVVEAIERHASGFIALDVRREGWTTSFPREAPFLVEVARGVVCVVPHDRIEGNWIWRWDAAPPPAECDGAVRLDDWLDERIG